MKLRSFKVLFYACLLSMLIVTASQASNVTLQWNPNTGTNTAGYKMYYKADSSTPPFNAAGSPINVKNVTTGTVTGLDPNRSYSFAVTAYDTSGVESSYSNIVSISESIAPTVSITSPASNSTLTGTVSVTAYATDNVGVSRVEHYLNGSLKATDMTTPYVYSLDTTSLAAGTYTLMAKAYDAAGNVGQSSNVSVTVVKDTIAPTVFLGVSGNNANVSGTAKLSANAIDNVGVTKVEFYANGALLYATNVAPFSYNWNTTTVSNASYTLIAKAYDNAGNVGQSGNVTVTVNNATTTPIPTPTSANYTFWSATAVPSVVDAGPDNAVELGVKFRADSSGYITGIRFYKGGANTGTHVGNLWSSTGTLLANATFTSETASGWQQATFSTPVAITANTVYVASYHSNNGHFSSDQTYFTGKGVDNGPLHALANGVSGSNGVYAYGTTSAFPTQTWNTSNYWVDVVFSTTAPASTSYTFWPATTVPGVVDAGPDNAVELGVKFRADSSGYITGIRFYKAGANTGTHVGNLWSSTGTLLAKATFTSETASGWQQVSFPIPVAITANTVYVASYHTNTGYYSSDQNYFTGRGVDNGPLHALANGVSGSNGVYAYGANSAFPNQTWNTSNYWVDVVFSQTAPALTSYFFWPDTTVPGVVDAGSDNAVELGAKFRADSSGYITGIRFYKASANTGTHEGNLWSGTGTLLAKATFTSETASGWQQVNFPTPVAITANTVYVVSYHSNNGHYSVDQNYFTGKGVDNGPLHALANGVSGTNGVYAYGASSTFPNQTWATSNYWVDVVFKQ